MDKTTTLRALALDAATDQADRLLQLSHERNYHTLYVSRDGNVFWAEDINADSLIIDDTASDLRPVHVITQVGTGSVDCNCGACNSDHSDSLDYAITLISDAFVSVPADYFIDEPKREVMEMDINAEKTIYRIQDAETELINFESADRTDGIYTPDFYEIVKIEEA